ncbi:hypothetical protein BURMUCGD1_4738 [Burkholderia multivorans CGD1]|nr:hypothetical protein BURMUCGD1_4738 [Burkholderia multivorans CGD1]
MRTHLRDRRARPRVRRKQPRRAPRAPHRHGPRAGPSESARLALPAKKRPAYTFLDRSPH